MRQEVEPSVEEILGDRLDELCDRQVMNKVFLDKIRGLQDKLFSKLLSAELFLDGIDVDDLKGSIDWDNFMQALVDAEKANEALLEDAANEQKGW